MRRLKNIMKSESSWHHFLVSSTVFTMTPRIISTGYVKPISRIDYFYRFALNEIKHFFRFDSDEFGLAWNRFRRMNQNKSGWFGMNFNPKLLPG